MSYLALGSVETALLLLLTGKQWTVCLGAFLYGIVSMFSATKIPLLVRAIWNGEQYTEVIVWIHTAAYVAYAACVSLLGYLYDFLGQYDEIILLLLGAAGVEGVLVRSLLRCKTRKEGKIWH